MNVVDSLIARDNFVNYSPSPAMSFAAVEYPLRVQCAVNQAYYFVPHNVIFHPKGVASRSPVWLRFASISLNDPINTNF